jgi:SAM-dependent methyltransferase
MKYAQPNFDGVARPYRWLEYLTLGRSLENTRNHYLPQLLHHHQTRHRALILGDGDGRFLAQLLASNPHLHADAVDTSAAMLRLLRQRCETAIPNATTRLHTHQSNALTFPLEDSEASYDLIVTHFFLDCLTQSELDALIQRIVKNIRTGTLWLISDFRIPPGPMHIPAKLFVRGLYLAFRILTGLRTTRLPNYATSLTQAGFVQISHQHRLAGILTTELWRS